MDIVDSLESLGLAVEQYELREEIFGNIHIKAQINHVKLMIVCDRGIWDCSVVYCHHEIPVVAVFYLLNRQSFDISTVSFDSDEAMLKWLTNHISVIKQLTNTQMFYILIRWIAVMLSY